MYDDLHVLPKLRDGLSYLYLERGRLEQEDSSVTFYGVDDVVPVPAASLAVVMLGPGTSVTHAAVRNLVENGCSILWVGDDATRFYAQGMGETRKATKLLKQALLWANPETRLQVIRKMYEYRFPEMLDPGLELNQIRGMEGVRVRDTYARLSRETGVEWKGRNYQRGDWSKADPINRALSAANACLYGVCHAGIVSAGYSPGLGFVHTGKQLSFVYDVADLFKAETTIPAAFEAVASTATGFEKEVRRICRNKFYEQKLLSRVLPAIEKIFDIPMDAVASSFDLEKALPGWLWDEQGPVAGGVNYGGDDSGSSTETPER